MLRMSAAVVEKLPSCAHCYAVESQNTTLKSCAKCGLNRYCSRKCQAIHWKNGHRKTCQPPELFVRSINQATTIGELKNNGFNEKTVMIKLAEPITPLASLRPRDQFLLGGESIVSGDDQMGGGKGESSLGPGEEHNHPSALGTICLPGEGGARIATGKTAAVVVLVVAATAVMAAVATAAVVGVVWTASCVACAACGCRGPRTTCAPSAWRRYHRREQRPLVETEAPRFGECSLARTLSTGSA
mmetsp:Transcript_82652/g.165195  ORF Transcript_82652/g.165195 Transcript_82652/m.165195 type:complete len:244 (+) Transcript_82652:66-797(+)